MASEMLLKKNKKFSRSYPDSDGDDIVISGMAGKFPNSKNISEYEYNLYNKVGKYHELRKAE